MSAQKSKVLAFIGQGYDEIPLAMASVDAGWIVIGVDNFAAKVDQINECASPVENVSGQQLQAAISNSLYQATTNFSVVSKASVVTICVPTPLHEQREPDLSLLGSTATGMAPNVYEKTLVASESTPYPGTLRNIITPIVNELKPVGTKNVNFTCAPERVNLGDDNWNQKNTPRLIGGVD